MKTLLAIAFALAFLPSPAQAEGTIIVGVDPGLYDVTVAGVQGWNAAGFAFVVEPSGCGTGDVTICYSADPYVHGGNEEWIAWYILGTNRIEVSTVSNYSLGPSSICHEVGHWLGLHYHRDDFQSCMSSPSMYSPPSPDSIDLANLGITWVDAEESVDPPVEAPEPDNDFAPLVTDFPNTGTGPPLPYRLLPGVTP